MESGEVTVVDPKGRVLGEPCARGSASVPCDGKEGGLREDRGNGRHANSRHNPILVNQRFASTSSDSFVLRIVRANRSHLGRMPCSRKPLQPLVSMCPIDVWSASKLPAGIVPLLSSSCRLERCKDAR